MGSNSVPSLPGHLPLKIRNEIQDNYQASTFGLEVKKPPPTLHYAEM